MEEGAIVGGTAVHTVVCQVIVARTSVSNLPTSKQCAVADACGREAIMRGLTDVGR